MYIAIYAIYNKAVQRGKIIDRLKLKICHPYACATANYIVAVAHASLVRRYYRCLLCNVLSRILKFHTMNFCEHVLFKSPPRIF